MFQNNMVYKGYRLTASVSRVAIGNARRPAFTATVAVELAGNQDRLSEPHAVPLFDAGGFHARYGGRCGDHAWPLDGGFAFPGRLTARCEPRGSVDRCP